MPHSCLRYNTGTVRAGKMIDIDHLLHPSKEELEAWFAQNAAKDLLRQHPESFGTVYADPPWRFSNRTGKMAPEYKRVRRYPTMSFDEIAELPVARIAKPSSHLYLWVPNALIAEGLDTMRRWGFQYKAQIIWYKVRKDGGPDRRGVGFYFRNVTEVCLFGVRGKHVRTREAGRRQPNIIVSQKGRHSEKPTEMYRIIEECSHGPYIELFARNIRSGWTSWGNEVVEGVTPEVRDQQKYEPCDHSLFASLDD